MISKRLKCLILFSLSVVIAVALLYRSFSEGYYIPLAITYGGKYDYPLITAEIQGKRCELAVRIGSRFPLFLRKEVLKSIDKQSQGTAEWHGINGSKHEGSAYLIPKLKVGNLELKDIVAYEADDKDYGILGRFLGGEFNLLLDFPHNLIIACDTFSKLQKKKLVDQNWINAPFEMHRSGIVFKVDTDFGTCKLLVNTTSKNTYLCSSFFSSNNPTDWISSSFSLGECQFGSIAFQPVDLPEGLGEIDGFIGMDFLKEHSMYFDYAHKIAYIAPPTPYLERIPITFMSRNSPTIDVSIDDAIYPLELDLGCSFPFSISSEVLKNIGKTKHGTARWNDLKGQAYESPAYTISKININNLVFIDALAKQDRADFHRNTTLRGSFSLPTGVIGLPILKKYNLLLDFPHSTIYASRDHSLLQKAGLLSQNLLTIPFVLHPDGIILSVTTDAGIYRLLLDTGATGILIRAPHPEFTEHFHIMEHDFGPRSILPFDLNSSCPFEGLLGMDFLREYPLFIDYANKIIFIDLQKNDNF